MIRFKFKGSALRASQPFRAPPAGFYLYYTGCVKKVTSGWGLVTGDLYHLKSRAFARLFMDKKLPIYMTHIFCDDPTVIFFFGHIAQSQSGFLQGAAVCEGLLRDLC